MTPALRELIASRSFRIGDGAFAGQLAVQGTDYARVGDWLASSSGEDLTVIHNDIFCEEFEEVAAQATSSILAARDSILKHGFHRLDSLLAEVQHLTVERDVFRRERDELIVRREHLRTLVRGISFDEPTHEKLVAACEEACYLLLGSELADVHDARTALELERDALVALREAVLAVLYVSPLDDDAAVRGRLLKILVTSRGYEIPGTR